MHEAQKMSEADNATLGQAVTRWLAFKESLQKLTTAHLQYLDGFIWGTIFSVRLSKQMIDLHTAAAMLTSVLLPA